MSGGLQNWMTENGRSRHTFRTHAATRQRAVAYSATYPLIPRSAGVSGNVWTVTPSISSGLGQAPSWPVPPDPS